MWVYVIVAALFVVGVVGAFAGGGIFTIVLIPVALVILGASVLFSMWGRSAQGAAGGATEETHASDRPLPHSRRRSTGTAPSSPEQLADARRAQQ
jgi:hypothetical protein